MSAILFEALLIEIQEEIHHFAGWEGGGSGLRGTKLVNKNIVNKLAFPNYTQKITELFLKQFRFGNSSTKLTEKKFPKHFGKVDPEIR